MCIRDRIIKLAGLFRKEAYFDLLLEAKTLCGESYVPVRNAEHGHSGIQQSDHAALPPLTNSEKRSNDDKLTTKNDSPGERIASRLKRLWTTLFGYQSQEMIHEMTEEIDLSSDRFKIAQLSEGLPGTPDEELGHHAYILTEEFVCLLYTSVNERGAPSGWLVTVPGALLLGFGLAHLFHLREGKLLLTQYQHLLGYLSTRLSAGDVYKRQV